jgi:hypothetical protein
VDHLLLHCEVCLCFVECLFWSVWVVLGDAETGLRVARLLVVYEEQGECGGLEDDAYLFFLVSMEGEK